MNYRTLGRTGMRVSEIGLGTWALGSGIYGRVEQDAPARLIRHAVDSGINFFDTAPLYGTADEDGVAETVLGQSLAGLASGVRISTKFGRTARNVRPGRFTAAEARESCEASLRRLGRDCIDVFFFHSPFSASEIADDVWEALLDLRQAGKILEVGHSVSLYAETAGMSADWMRERRIAVVQVVLSPFNREARPLIATALQCGCGVIARECMANGFLSGTVTADTVFPAGSLNSRYNRGEIAARAAYAGELAAAMVGGARQNLPQAAYRWILDQPGVALALSGAKQPDELDDPLAASALDPLDADTLASVEAMHRQDFGAA